MRKQLALTNYHDRRRECKCACNPTCIPLDCNSAHTETEDSRAKGAKVPRRGGTWSSRQNYSRVYGGST